MTELTKKVSRRTRATVFERSVRRNVVVSLEPSQKIGLRLEGTRRTYRVDLEALYSLTVKLHLEEIERVTKRLMKLHGWTKRKARGEAAKELAKELK